MKKRKPTVKKIDGKKIVTNKPWHSDLIETTPEELLSLLRHAAGNIYRAGIARGRALATRSGRKPK